MSDARLLGVALYTITNRLGYNAVCLSVEAGAKHPHTDVTARAC
jgi:hypothetical protein